MYDCVSVQCHFYACTTNRARTQERGGCRYEIVASDVTLSVMQYAAYDMTSVHIF